ncbi:MAG TPA: hypothetical protein VIT92_14975 [Burkholderiaceae bacterium]
MGHSLHNRIHTKSTFGAAQLQAIALAAGFAGVGIVYLVLKLIK